MEKAIEILLQQSALVFFMGIAIYFLWRKIDKLETDITKLQTYILDREKEFAEERMNEQRETIEALNRVATVLHKHNELTENEQRKKT